GDKNPHAARDSPAERRARIVEREDRRRALTRERALLRAPLRQADPVAEAMTANGESARGAIRAGSCTARPGERERGENEDGARPEDGLQAWPTGPRSAGQAASQRLRPP